MILFNYVPSKMGILLKEIIRSQRERILSFKSSSLGMINYLYQTGWPLLNVTIFITQVRNCVMGATPMTATTTTRAVKHTREYDQEMQQSQTAN